MTKCLMTITAGLCLAVAMPAWSLDQIKTTSKDKAYQNGKITAITPQAVEIETSGGVPAQIPVNEIVGIMFSDEPRGLKEAQEKITHGNYEEALTALENVNASDIVRREMLDEVNFSKAYCAAQVAMAGNGDMLDAGKQLLAFVNGSPNSFHYWQTCELLGNVLVAMGNYAKAQDYYARLAKAPWPDYKMRAQIALGRALVAQNKFTDASRVFDEAITSDASGDLAEVQRMSAKVGRARCLAAANQTDAAIAILKDIIAKADNDNVELNATAYNALGTALRKAGKSDEALRAFLHVHLLYNTQPDAHAEALSNLATLFIDQHYPIHAREVRGILQRDYPNSRWAKQVQ